MKFFTLTLAPLVFANSIYSLPRDSDNIGQQENDNLEDQFWRRIFDDSMQFPQAEIKRAAMSPWERMLL
ncbi:Oidioi.mRNA.OKI2018_I69.XSR.g13763.t1.cds [Oikopleura dioica]|uniref:Oidioi.mRNA.OKI2018_I69.XSR.g13763.t1.cds n=1 Tax=Oikopleura dioica TaxID=34765 RepID=A0ABN7S7T5_OIKDI|nr:Oidioi.mRNA.OKI2018_I69.XSR.g13763.t1.cds [Oikopleura dioica]